MNKLHLTIITVVLSLICNYSIAQPLEKLSAKDYLLEQDYNSALKEYLRLYKSKKISQRNIYKIK